MSDFYRHYDGNGRWDRAHVGRNFPAMNRSIRRLGQPIRSLEQYRAELVAEYEATPETHYSTLGKLASRIREVDAEIGRRS